MQAGDTLAFIKLKRLGRQTLEPQTHTGYKVENINACPGARYPETRFYGWVALVARGQTVVRNCIGHTTIDIQVFVECVVDQESPLVEGARALSAAGATRWAGFVIRYIRVLIDMIVGGREAPA